MCVCVSSIAPKQKRSLLYIYQWVLMMSSHLTHTQMPGERGRAAVVMNYARTR